MKTILSSLLLLAPLAVLTQQPAAKASDWNMYYQGNGNYGYGTISGPRGYSGSFTQQRIGNTIYSNFNGRHGSSSCTTQFIGNQVYRSCR